MPKALTRPQPSSSIANALDAEALRSAKSPAGTHTPTTTNEQTQPTLEIAAPRDSTPPAPSVPTGEPANIGREFILTESTERTVKKAVELYARATKSDLTRSHFMRSLLKAVEHAWPQLEQEAARMGMRKLPSNARGKEREREAFEERLTASIVAGMRLAAAYDAKS